MTCDDLRDEYELHALGLSDDPERAEIEEHLRRGCVECTAGMKRAMALNAGMMAITASDAQPSKQLRRRVLASVGAGDDSWWWSKIAWPIAALSILLALFVVNMRDRRHQQELAAARQEISRSSAELSRVQAALAFLNEPETKHVVFGQGQPQPPRGRFFVNQQRGVLLIASNLPQLGPGKTYELWVIPKGGAPRPAGLFQSQPGGTALYLSSGPIDPATAAVAVSVEPEAGSPAPTTTPIIVAPVAD